MKRRFKKSIVMPSALFIYTTAMAIYFIPRNHSLSDTEKWGTVIVSYLIILALWWVLNKKEKMMKKKEEELMNKK